MRTALKWVGLHLISPLAISVTSRVEIPVHSPAPPSTAPRSGVAARTASISSAVGFRWMQY